ncbi:MAG: hypothetical protein M1818_004848 [Claussenomyces sp. TS43310]|nr:MAG: hypothetical protein M1818_004848 [Claussenomyces sp. TS43310]
MAGLTILLSVYLLGGVSVLPLLIIAALVHAHFTFPIRDDAVSLDSATLLLREDDDPDLVQSAASGLHKKFHSRGSQELDVAAGYFAVCREYVPGGVNGKPPERTTPAGSTVVSSPSPSVYQSMYRSIFDRKQSASPLDKGAGKLQRKGGNVFYVVLRYCARFYDFILCHGFSIDSADGRDDPRHSHLMLFDDDEMTEVRYVISLAHHDVSIYGGGEHMPDGELFIKRNALCLSRKSDAGELTADGTMSKPFYLFTENTSTKEDFYFAMLKNQERIPEAKTNPPIPLRFEVKHIIDLVQRLHSSEEQLQTRWINALMGRIFLGLYKTTDVENFIRAKITKKISRVKTPSFLSKIVLKNVDMGEGAPYITSPRLKDLTVDGDCVVEADVKYTGNFRLEIAATARIELGSRFKAREVNLVLAVVIKKVEGHMLLRIKPPPSNRLWYTFVTMPKLEFSVEPIVSSRQITYTLILRQIENRIKEVIAESIVMPFWDDTAFFSTEGKRWRGGVWADDEPKHFSHDPETQIAEAGDVNEVERMESDSSSHDMPQMEKSMSVPVLDPSPSSTVYPRKTVKSVFNLSSSKAAASTTSVDTAKSSISEKPKVVRNASFAAFAAITPPVLSTNVTVSDPFKPEMPPGQSHAADAMAAISSRSQPVTPVGSPRSQIGLEDKAGSYSSISSHASEQAVRDQIEHIHASDYSSQLEELTPQQTHHNSVEDMPASDTNHDPPSPSSLGGASVQSGSSKLFRKEPQRQDSTSTASSIKSTGTPESANPPKRIMLTSVANAAASAKRWGLNALSARNGDYGKGSTTTYDEGRPDTSLPMGRGRPLPPPGTPLPLPDRKTKTAPIPVPKRKPVAGPQAISQSTAEQDCMHVSISPPALPKRQGRPPTTADTSHDGIFIVPAPDSGPTTPIEGSKQKYLPPWVDDVEDEDTGHPRRSGNSPSEDTSPPESYSVEGRSNRNKVPPDLPSPHRAASRPPALPRRPRKSLSSSPEEHNNQLPSWMAAQEEEARSKSMFVDEDSGNLHQ